MTYTQMLFDTGINNWKCIICGETSKLTMVYSRISVPDSEDIIFQHPKYFIPLENVKKGSCYCSMRCLKLRARL